MHAICAPACSTRVPDILHILVVFTQFVDGLNLAIHEPSDPDEQNVSFMSSAHDVQVLLCCKLLTGKMHGVLFVYALQQAYYNGWLSSTVCSNLFVFSPLGEIIYCYLNAPGCQHDSTLAQELYDLLRRCTPLGFALAADTAFSSSGDMKDRIFKPLSTSQLQAKANDKTVSVKKLAALLKAHRACVSVRQGSEWGMNSIQNCWRRTNLKMASAHARRRVELTCIARLFNLRTRTTGISQLRTVYSEDYMGCFRTDQTAGVPFMNALDVTL